MDVVNMPQIVPMDEREWFVLFAICVAGKSAKQTQGKLNAFLKDACTTAPEMFWGSPFDLVWYLNREGLLDTWLRKHKMGQYKRIFTAFVKVQDLDITEDLTVEKLEAIPGIGPKTARFIVLYTNPDAEVVPLDTHILKFLNYQYPAFSVPKSTPPAGKKYKQLEEMFQYEAKRLGKSVRQLDTEIWQSYART